MNYIARISPQAWINNVAIEVDPPGELEWETDLQFLRAPWDEYREFLIEDLADGREILDAGDCLRADPSAPEWVSGWNGPFDIYLRKGSEDDD